MKRRSWLWLTSLLLLPLGAGAEAGAAWNAPIIDLRVGLANSMLRDPSLARGFGQAGYVELRKGGVSGVLLPLPAPSAEPSAKSAFFDYVALRAALESSQQFAIDACERSTGRISVWFELEAPNELAGDPRAVPLWIEHGVRVFRIGEERNNLLVTAAAGTALGASPGLSPIGREVVSRIYASGGVADVSDASPRTIDDVLALAAGAGGPVIATHSNARALFDRPRNLSDASIRGIAQSGGIVAATALRSSLPAGRLATLDHLVHQISYLVRVAGAEHVALGSGFELATGPVRDFLSAADFPRLATSLRSAGLSAPDVERVFYRNAERVLCASRRPR